MVRDLCAVIQCGLCVKLTKFVRMGMMYLAEVNSLKLHFFNFWHTLDFDQSQAARPNNFAHIAPRPFDFAAAQGMAPRGRARSPRPGARAKR
jgi:hypothetical protein